MKQHQTDLLNEFSLVCSSSEGQYEELHIMTTRGIYRVKQPKHIRDILEMSYFAALGTT